MIKGKEYLEEYYMRILKNLEKIQKWIEKNIEDPTEEATISLKEELEEKYGGGEVGAFGVFERFLPSWVDFDGLEELTLSMKSGVIRPENLIEELKERITQLEPNVLYQEGRYQQLAELLPFVDPKILLKDERYIKVVPPPIGELGYVSSTVRNIMSSLKERIDRCIKWYRSDEEKILECIDDELDELYEEIKHQYRKVDSEKLKNELREIFEPLVEKGVERGLFKIKEELEKKMKKTR